MKKVFNKENKDVKKQIEILHNKLKIYSDYYYNKNESLISDFEFDKLLKELEQLEKQYPEYKKEHSLTEEIGKIDLKATKFKKIKHKKPMLSLNNSYNIEDMKAFFERVKKNIKIDREMEYVLELKLDGASISIIYEKGVLIKAVTRGDGIEGEDVTENILMIESIPKKLSENINIELRGEIVLPLSRFKQLNIEREKTGEESFANPRNVASGTLRQLDANIVKERGLDGYFYFIVNPEKYGLKTHIDSLLYIKKLGIKTTGVCELIKDIKSLENRIEYWDKNRNDLDYETDGLVIKLNDIEFWEKLGYTTKSPRWAIAYKFPATKISTRLEGIVWQVGRTGKITPVAQLQEVELSGSQIKRASLHNMDEINRKDIKIGDMVFIEKAAEIIPQVICSIKKLRDGNEREVVAPTKCPVCESDLLKEDGAVDLKCINQSCPAIIKGGIEYFVSRNAMNIIGFGNKNVEKFLELGYIFDITDIYRLKQYKDELIKLDKMGEKSVENILQSIENSKSRPYSKTLYALGIPYVGKYLATVLAKASGTINNLIKMTEEELVLIDGVGEKVAKSVYNYFRDENFINIVKKLQSYGINFKEDNNETFENMKLKGKTFLFTGKLTKLKREDIKEIVENLGGEILSSVNKKLNYLVVGENAGTKLKKAENLKTVNILTEDEFFELIES